jgi:hypothetical protein
MESPVRNREISFGIEPEELVWTIKVSSPSRENIVTFFSKKF